MDVKGLAVDTVRHYLAILKKVCRIAYKEGYAERCHFANFTLPQKTERTPRALSREDFEKIRDVEIPAWRTTHILVRDLFLFACYTGTAYADAVSVTRDNLYADDEGCLWLKYSRQKNELRASVKLLPEALALIEKYHDDNRPTLFPMVYHPNLPPPAHEIPCRPRGGEQHLVLPSGTSLVRLADYAGSRSAD